MTPRWTRQGDGLFTAPGGYSADQPHPLEDRYTLILPCGAKHIGTAQQCRDWAAQYAKEVMQ